MWLSEKLLSNYILQSISVLGPIFGIPWKIRQYDLFAGPGSKQRNMDESGEISGNLGEYRFHNLQVSEKPPM